MTGPNRVYVSLHHAPEHGAVARGLLEGGEGGGGGLLPPPLLHGDILEDRGKYLPQILKNVTTF